jgi:hypothetical protein
MRCCETRQSSYWPNPAARDRRPNPAPKRSDALGREQTTARILLQGPTAGRLRFQPSRPAPSLPHQVPNEHAENAGTRKRRHPREAPALDPLENGIRKQRSFADGCVKEHSPTLFCRSSHRLVRDGSARKRLPDGRADWPLPHCDLAHRRRRPLRLVEKLVRKRSANKAVEIIVGLYLRVCFFIFLSRLH